MPAGGAIKGRVADLPIEQRTLLMRRLRERQGVAALARPAARTAAQTAAQELVTGPCFLTPGQHYFFLVWLYPPFNVEILPDFEEVDPVTLRRAFHAVLRHHDGLRSRFLEEGGEWSAVLDGPPAEPPLTWVDVSGLSDEEIERQLDEPPDFADLFDLHRGPMLHLLAFDGGPGRPVMLLLGVHHLVADGYSIGLIEQDLRLACEQVRRGEPAALPAKTTSLQAWGERLRRRALAADLPEELAFWMSPARRAARPLPVDDPGGDDTHRSSRTLVQRLPRGLTRELLGAVPRRLRARLDEVFLALLQQAFGEWPEVESVLTDLVLHGRDTPFPDVDLLRTVGWLSIGYPLLLEISAEPEDPVSGLRRLQAARQAVPFEGFGWSLLHRRTEPEIVAAIAAKPRASLLLNLVLEGTPPETGAEEDGEEMELISPPAELVTQAALDRERPHQMSVVVQVAEGWLEIAWGYSIGRHRTATVERLAEAFFRAAERMAAASRRAEDEGAV